MSKARQRQKRIHLQPHTYIHVHIHIQMQEGETQPHHLTTFYTERLFGAAAFSLPRRRDLNLPPAALSALLREREFVLFGLHPVKPPSFLQGHGRRLLWPTPCLLHQCLFFCWEQAWVPRTRGQLPQRGQLQRPAEPLMFPALKCLALPLVVAPLI